MFSHASFKVFSESCNPGTGQICNSSRIGEVSGRHLVTHVEDFCQQPHKQQTDLLRGFTYGLSVNT